MGVPEDFALERIRWNPAGNNVFGNTLVQEIIGQMQGSREDPAVKADQYSTETLGKIVCALATLNVQVTFETGWFSSTPQRMVLTSAVGKRGRITADLVAANDGPENVTRWRLTATDLAGNRRALPKDDPGILLKCLLSTTSEERIGGLLTDFMDALVGSDTRALTDGARREVSGDFWSMSRDCPPIRAHMGLEK